MVFIIKILVYGAGVIGSIFAYKLKTGGNEVSVLARGKRLQDLRQYGIVIRDDIFHKEYKTLIDVVETLEKDDYYDIILVIMQRQQVSHILPILKSNISPTILFIGNNPTGAVEYSEYIEKDRILLGFGGIGGCRESYRIIAAYVEDIVLYVGELDGKISDRLKKIENDFTKSGIKVDFSENIDAWLKTHAALVSPLAMGSYAARHRNIRLGDDIKLVDLALKGFKENIKALIDLNIPILPKKYRMMRWIPLFIIRKKILNLINSDFGRIALSVHADAAEQEMKKLTIDFFEIVKDSKTKLDVNRQLWELSFM